MDLKKTMKTKTNKTILSSSPNAAVRQMMSCTRALIDFADKEMRALVQNNMMELFVLQREKDHLAQKYTTSSAEFRARIEEFKKADRALLNQLEKLQDDLNDRTTENNKLITQAYKKSRSKTQDTLLSVQELAQKHPVTLDNGAMQQSGA